MSRPTDSRLLPSARGALGVVLVILATAFVFAPVVSHPFLNWDDPQALVHNERSGRPGPPVLGLHHHPPQPLPAPLLALLGGPPAGVRSRGRPGPRGEPARPRAQRGPRLPARARLLPRRGQRGPLGDDEGGRPCWRPSSSRFIRCGSRSWPGRAPSPMSWPSPSFWCRPSCTCAPVRARAGIALSAPRLRRFAPEPSPRPGLPAGPARHRPRPRTAPPTGPRGEAALRSPRHQARAFWRRTRDRSWTSSAWASAPDSPRPRPRPSSTSAAPSCPSASRPSTCCLSRRARPGRRCWRARLSSPCRSGRGRGSGARQPWLVVGAFAYLCLLAPALGLAPSGLQATADRYTYFPDVALALWRARVSRGSSPGGGRRCRWPSCSCWSSPPGRACSSDSGRTP